MARAHLKVAGLAALAAVLGACVSAPDEAPAWFAARDSARAGDYPSLHSVPRETSANTNAAYWAGHEQALVAAGAELKGHPRATQPVAAADPEAFIEDARQELEDARLSHTP